MNENTDETIQLPFLKSIEEAHTFCNELNKSSLERGGFIEWRIEDNKIIPTITKKGQELTSEECKRIYD